MKKTSLISIIVVCIIMIASSCREGLTFKKEVSFNALCLGVKYKNGSNQVPSESEILEAFGFSGLPAFPGGLSIPQPNGVRAFYFDISAIPNGSNFKLKIRCNNNSQNNFELFEIAQVQIDPLDNTIINTVSMPVAPEVHLEDDVITITNISDQPVTLNSMEVAVSTINIDEQSFYANSSQANSLQWSSILSNDLLLLPNDIFQYSIPSSNLPLPTESFCYARINFADEFGNFSSSVLYGIVNVHNIPTLSQWGLIILGLLTLIIGIVSLRQEEKAIA